MSAAVRCPSSTSILPANRARVPCIQIAGRRVLPGSRSRHASSDRPDNDASVVDKGRPGADAQPQVVITRFPVVNTSLLVVTTGLRVVTTRFPVVTTGLPVVTAGFTVVTTGLPDVTTGHLVVAARRRVVITRSPVVNTSRLVVTTRRCVVTARPVVIDTNPRVSTTRAQRSPASALP